MKKLILLVMIAAGVLLSACACNCEPAPEDEAAAQARVEAILCDM